MSKTKAQLETEIAELNERIKSLLDRVHSAESNVETSRPYLLLSRKLAECEQENARLRQQLQGTKIEVKPTVPQQISFQNPKMGRPTKITQEQRAQVTEMRDLGASLRTIAKEVGLSLKSVQNILSDRKRDAIIEEKRLELENGLEDYVREKVEEDMTEWLKNNPEPDEDEDGLHAVYCHEEAYHNAMEESEEYWTEHFQEQVLPEELERFEMDLDSPDPEEDDQ